MVAHHLAMVEEARDESAERADRISNSSAPPSISRTSFCCPHCGAFTHQSWYRVAPDALDKDYRPYIPNAEDEEEVLSDQDISEELRETLLKDFARLRSGNLFFSNCEGVYSKKLIRNLWLSKCYTCDEMAVWVHDRLVFPPQRNGPEANSDLPGDVKADYEEARAILNLSPRGAAALLRLCVEKLVDHLEAQGAKLDQKIADLVKKGLSPRVQKALDAVRVIGNEAVHPGRLSLKDDHQTAETLCRLVNVIAEKMITEVRHVDEVYQSLPPGSLEAIERRDTTSKTKS